MKNAALLVSCLGILFLLMTGILLLEPNSRGARRPAWTGQPAPDAAALELEKNRSTLRHLEENAQAVPRALRIGNVSGNDALERLFPLPESPAATLARSAAPSSPPESGRSPGESAPPRTFAAAPVPALSAALPGSPESGRSVLSDLIDSQLSFIFISPGFRRVIIDGHFAREGDLLPGGVRLVAIHDSSVVVRKGRTRQRIEIPAIFPEPSVPMP